MTTSIVGIGQTQVGEHWDVNLRHLAWQAIEAAMDDARTTEIDALYVGNMLAGTASGQEHLGALIADYSGLRGVEAVVVEAGEASGAAAVRQATMAVLSGQVQTALVVGVEKATDQTGKEGLKSQTTSLDAEFETIHGLTPAATAGLMMQRYMHEYGVEVNDFAGFSVNAHANGRTNPHAMYRNLLKAEKFGLAPLVADPVNLFDAAPVGDGAAAVIITATDRVAAFRSQPVEITGSAIATDAFALHDRKNILELEAVSLSTQRALAQAGMGINDIDLIELHDGFTILSALAIEAMGLAAAGEGVRFANEETIGRNGTMPISTFGGLKARGNPAGATGVYQIVEVAAQLRGEAGDNQVANARAGLAQNIGGTGGTAVTHVLKVASGK